MEHNTAAPKKVEVASRHGDGEARAAGFERASYRLHIEAEVHHVTILNDIVLSLDAEYASLLALGLVAVLDELLPGHNLCANEAPFDCLLYTSPSPRDA